MKRVTSFFLVTGIWILTGGAIYNASLIANDQVVRNHALGTEVRKPSLFQTVAPLYFPIHPKTGKIQFPPEVTTLAIDIGARQSDYLATLEQTRDETVALIMFDPLPLSFLPIQRRAAQYTLFQSTLKTVHPKRRDRVFAINAAVGEREGTATFHVAEGPACGSLLSTSKNGAQRQACVKTNELRTVAVFTLKDILDMIPDDGGLKSIHIKIDAEGADLSVLKGAGTAIQRASSVIIECQNLGSGDPRILRRGSCLYMAASDFMCQKHGYCQSTFQLSGPKNMMGNVFFSTDEAVDVPPFYQKNTIQFNGFYRTLAAKKEKSSV